MNTFSFNQENFGAPFDDSTFRYWYFYDDDTEVISRAFELFLLNIRPEFTKLLRSVTFFLYIPMENAVENLRSLAVLVQQMPNAQVKIYNEDWNAAILPSHNARGRQSAIDDYMAVGHTFQALIATSFVDQTSRNWRLYSTLKTRYYLVENLKGEELETALVWETDGL